MDIIAGCDPNCNSRGYNYGDEWEYASLQGALRRLLVRQRKSVGKDDLVLFGWRGQNGKSGAKMQDQLTGNSDETSAVGDYETTLNAASPSEVKKLGDGLDTLFASAAGAPWYDTTTDNRDADEILSGAIARSDPRVVYLIVTPSTSNPHNGTFDTQVQGFAPVYLESYDDGGGKDDTFSV